MRLVVVLSLVFLVAAVAMAAVSPVGPMGMAAASSSSSEEESEPSGPAPLNVDPHAHADPRLKKLYQKAKKKLLGIFHG